LGCGYSGSDQKRKRRGALLETLKEIDGVDSWTAVPGSGQKTDLLSQKRNARIIFDGCFLCPAHTEDVAAYLTATAGRNPKQLARKAAATPEQLRAYASGFCRSANGGRVATGCFHQLPPVVVGAAKDVGHEPWAATVEHIRSTFPGGALLAYVEELERALPARSKLKRPAALLATTEVQGIVSRTVGGPEGILYRVKWKGKGKRHNSWVTSSLVSEEMCATYEAAKAAKKAKKAAAETEDMEEKKAAAETEDPDSSSEDDMSWMS